MSGLGAVASAFNANDPCLARIAAVHLRIPDLPDTSARDAMEAEDRVIKDARREDSDWNPALHPRAGGPPNPGWFAPTTGEADERPIPTAQNRAADQTSDSATGSNYQAGLRSGPKRIDELADFAEWLANATPDDEAAIRSEIKRYFEDVGWGGAAHDLNTKLSVVLRPGVTPEIRQRVLDSIDVYTRADPAEYVGTRDFLNAVVLAGAGLLATSGAPSLAWKLGWAKRGQIIHDQFGDPTFPPNYPIIDRIPDGIATSIKSIDLNAKTYQNDISLTNRVLKCVDDVREFEGADWGGKSVKPDDIAGRALEVIVPRGTMTESQHIVFERARAKALQDPKPVDIILTEF